MCLSARRRGVTQPGIGSTGQYGPQGRPQVGPEVDLDVEGFVPAGIAFALGGGHARQHRREVLRVRFFVDPDLQVDHDGSLVTIRGASGRPARPSYLARSRRSLPSRRRTTYRRGRPPHCGTRATSRGRFDPNFPAGGTPERSGSRVAPPSPPPPRTRAGRRTCAFRPPPRRAT